MMCLHNHVQFTYYIYKHAINLFTFYKHAIKMSEFTLQPRRLASATHVAMEDRARTGQTSEERSLATPVTVHRTSQALNASLPHVSIDAVLIYLSYHRNILQLITDHLFYDIIDNGTSRYTMLNTICMVQLMCAIQPPQSDNVQFQVLCVSNCQLRGTSDT